MERIRDFLYDISDLLISLLIIAVIFAVISWKLNESIPIDIAAAPPAAEEPVTPAEEPADSADPGDVADASDADKPIEGTPVTITPVIPDDTATPPEKPAGTPAGQTVSVEIPSGSPGVAIGQILKEKGLIPDVNAFIKKVDEMGLGPKLRSGTFSLKTGMSLEEIIKILANVS